MRSPAWSGHSSAAAPVARELAMASASACRLSPRSPTLTPAGSLWTRFRAAGSGSGSASQGTRSEKPRAPDRDPASGLGHAPRCVGRDQRWTRMAGRPCWLAEVAAEQLVKLRRAQRRREVETLANQAAEAHELADLIHVLHALGDRR